MTDTARSAPSARRAAAGRAHRSARTRGDGQRTPRPTPAGYVDLDDLAEVLGVTRWALERRRQRGSWEASGLPPVEMVGGMLGVRQELFDAWAPAARAAAAHRAAAEALRHQADQLEQAAREALTSPPTAAAAS